MYTNFYTDNNFLFEQAKNGQKKALWKNATILGILLICYNIFAELFSYVYYFAYYFVSTKKFTLRLSVIKDYLSENIKSISVTEFNMLGSAFVMLLSLISILIVAVFVAKLKITELFRCTPKGLLTGIKATPFAILLNYISTVIIAFITAAFASNGVVIPSVDFGLDKPTFLAGFSTFLYVVVLAPIIEEVVYRGFVLKLISPYGKTASIFISAFIFGFMHGNLSQFAGAFVSGLVYATVAVCSGSIVPTIIMHMINNCLNFISTCANDYDSEICAVIYSTLFVTILLVGIMQVFLFRRIISKRPQETTLLTKSETLKAVFTNPAVLVYLAYLLYDLVSSIIIANLTIK